MAATVRKSVRLPQNLADEVARLNNEQLNFSRIVQRALRGWAQRQRRRLYADLVRQAAAQRSDEQEAEDRALVGAASQSGHRVLEKELGGG